MLNKIFPFRKKIKSKEALQPDARDASDLLFVYGTLMQGFENAPFLQDPARARYLGNGSMQGVLYDVGAFPAFLPEQKHADNAPGWVHGEIYQIEDPEIVLATLDVIEGVNDRYPERSLFVRKCLPVRLGDHEKLAWVYVYNQPVDELLRIQTGDYREYVKQKEFSDF